MYRAANMAIVDFKALLSSEQLTKFSNVEEFSEYLDVVAPQLAHYYGYLAANDFAAVSLTSVSMR